MKRLFAIAVLSASLLAGCNVSTTPVVFEDGSVILAQVDNVRLVTDAEDGTIRIVVLKESN